ncbi:MAG: TonB family protein [Opitutae bacterium]|nr:TonB family protein [Opitutae bacterium]
MQLKLSGKFAGGLALAALVAMARAEEKTETVDLSDFGSAFVDNWVPPVYPDGPKKEKLNGQAIVEFIVGPDGRVTEAHLKSASDPRFGQPAVDAVMKWTFIPARFMGEAQPSAMDVAVIFRIEQLKKKRQSLMPPVMPRPLDKTPPRGKKFSDPIYPAEMESRKMPGEVQLEFIVSPQGEILRPKVTSASDAAFVAAALDALKGWEFEPAHRGTVAVGSEMASPIEFQTFGADRAEVLNANRVSGWQDAGLETLPLPVVMPAPAYPFAALLADEAGEAEVKFTLSDRGLVRDVAVVRATKPDFGASLAAAVEQWEFKPAMREDRRVPLELSITWMFAPPEANAAPHEAALARLVAALKPDGAGVASAAGLDRKLVALWQPGPAYPNALREQQLTGDAEMEFVIDRTGRVRVPRTVKATAPEFGWAAAMAVGQWVFAPPMRKGEPVEVRARISINFTKPGE